MKFALATLIVVFGLVQAIAQEPMGQFASFERASEPILNDPHDLEIGPDGHLYVADKFGGRITVLNAETLELIEYRNQGQLPGVHDIDFDDSGRAVIAVTGLGAVLVFNDFVNKSDTPDLTLPASRTEGALAHSNGRIYAVAGGIGSLLAYEGDQLVASASGHSGAHDVAEAPDGSIWLADNFNRRLVRYSSELELLQIINHSKFGFVGPRYLDVDDFGRLIVADQDAHRILMIDPSGQDGGTLLGVIGSGSPGIGPNIFDDPEGVEIQGGQYFFADSDNNRIVKYTVVTN
ncbi:MAG: NHL repeat-containing protein [Rhizobiaceae bacterium]